MNLRRFKMGTLHNVRRTIYIFKGVVLFFFFFVHPTMHYDLFRAAFDTRTVISNTFRDKGDKTN